MYLVVVDIFIYTRMYISLPQGKAYMYRPLMPVKCIHVYQSNLVGNITKTKLLISWSRSHEIAGNTSNTSIANQSTLLQRRLNKLSRWPAHLCVAMGTGGCGIMVPGVYMAGEYRSKRTPIGNRANSCVISILIEQLCRSIYQMQHIMRNYGTTASTRCKLMPKWC